MGAITYIAARASRLADGLQNLVANLGSERDKAAHSFYAPPLLTPDQAINAYRSAWLPRRIVEMPALDATRKWRSWQGSAAEITALEAEERRLNLREKVLQSLTMARLHGASALLIGTGSSQPDEPLDLDAEVPQRGGLRYVTPLIRRHIVPGPIETDVTSPFFGQPRHFDVAFTAGGSQVRVHPSRLVQFVGAPLPDTDLTMGWGGESVLVAAYDAITQVDATAANIASLVFEAKVDVIRVQDLMESLQGDPNYEDLMRRRFTLAATAKGINGMLLLDKDEEYEQKTASFATLPDVLDRFYQAVAGAAEIPVSRLFGRSAAGLNATGDGDERVYYDRVQALQELEIQPAMTVLDDALIRSALGTRPAELHYVWTPLRQKTDGEVADIGKTIAETVRALRESQVFREDVLARAGSNALIEAGALPGLEAAIADLGLDLEEPDAADEAAALGGGARLVASADAEPRTLYVRRDVLNGEEIVAWAKSQGFETTLAAEDLHITIAFSRQPVDWMKVGEEWPVEVSGGMTIAAGGPRMMERFGEAAVLLVASSSLSWRHEEIRRAGASWDYPEYQPHVTISYAAGDLDISKVEPYRGAIELGPEIFEPLDEDWKSRVSEE